MGKLSPTQRTLREMRKMGRICGIVERFNGYAGPHGVRQDLFGFIDIIALDPQDGIVGVQSTGTDYSGHLKKITQERAEEVREWLSCGGVVELWAWRKVKQVKGGTKMVYRPRVKRITVEDLVFDSSPAVDPRSLDASADPDDASQPPPE